MRYTQGQKIVQPNNEKGLGIRIPKCLKRIAEIGLGHLCLREENLI